MHTEKLDQDFCLFSEEFAKYPLLLIINRLFLITKGRRTLTLVNLSSSISGSQKL